MTIQARSIGCRALALAAAVALASAWTAAAQAQRVRFERGRTGAVLKGRIANGTGPTYLLGAQRGQTLILHIASDSPNNDVVVSVRGPRGEDVTDGITTDWTGTLPSTGDYRIDVGAVETDSARFTLEVTIR